METSNESIAQLLNNPVSLWVGILLTLAGMFFYYMSAMIGGTNSIQKFSDIKLAIWWGKNQIKFVMICMVITILFYLSYRYNELTAQHCLELGLAGNLFLDNFLTRMGVGKS